MRTAIGAADRRSHLTFPLVADVRLGGRVLAARLKTGAARVCWFCPSVRSFGIEIIKPFHHPSIFGSIGLFFREAGSKRRVVSQQSKYRTPYEASIAPPLTGLVQGYVFGMDRNT